MKVALHRCFNLIPEDKSMKRAIKKGLLCVSLAAVGIIASIAAFVYTYEEFYGDLGGIAIMIPAAIILPAVLSAIIGGICGSEIKRLWFLPLPLVFIMTYLLIPDMFLIFAALSYLFAVICALIKHFHNSKRGRRKEKAGLRCGFLADLDITLL